jgi:gluconate 2-dehydrogenase gamma chain
VQPAGGPDAPDRRDASRDASEDAERGAGPRLTRRSFLAATGALAAAGMVPGCTRDAPPDTALPDELPREGSAAVPDHGLQVPELDAGAAARFLNPEQYALIEAIAARLIPGDEDDPGAVQAGAVDYIDRLLATHDGWPQRTYTAGPHAQGYDPAEEEPEPENGVIWVPEDQLERYGWQSIYTPREIYRMGLARFQELVAARHGATAFGQLSEDEQDAFLEAVEDAEDDDVAEIFDPVGGDVFFDLVLKHVTEGFLADPMYGGNRDLVGWQLIGFPGAQRAYSPQEMLQPDFFRPPQSLAQLAMVHGAHDEHGRELGSVRRRHPAGPID